MSSTFSVNASRHWGSSASIACLVNQSGLIETWVRHPLPDVLYQPDPPEVIDLTARVYEGTSVNFSVRSGEANPRVSHNCSAEHGLIKIAAENWTLLGSTTVMSYKPDRRDSRVRCSAVQIFQSKVVFNYSFEQNVGVNFAPSSSWTATRPLAVKEGERLSVSLRSVGGKPEPTHQCWLQLADGHNVTVASESQRTVERHEWKLETSFSVTSSRSMNEAIVVCRAFQENLEDLGAEFRQNVSVLFASNDISWSGGLLNGSVLNLTGKTPEGNPRPELDCSLKTRAVGIEGIVRVFEPDERGSNGGWVRTARLFHRFAQQQSEVTVSCEISQAPFSPVKSTSTFPAEFPPQSSSTDSSLATASRTSPSSGSVTMVVFCCSLAAAAAISAAISAAVTFAVLKRMRAATIHRSEPHVEMSVRQVEVEVKPPDPNTVYYYEE